VGLAPFGGARATPEQVALALAGFGVLEGDGSDGEAAGGSGVGGAGGAGLVKGLVQRLVEPREEQRDESSDFDD
jgi:hypothetical protein